MLENLCRFYRYFKQSELTEQETDKITHAWKKFGNT
jgi:hypothetical protein